MCLSAQYAPPSPHEKIQSLAITINHFAKKQCAEIHFILSARVLAPPLHPRLPEIVKAVSTQLPFRIPVVVTPPCPGPLRSSFHVLPARKLNAGFEAHKTPVLRASQAHVCIDSHHNAVARRCCSKAIQAHENLMHGFSVCYNALFAVWQMRTHHQRFAGFETHSSHRIPG